MSCLFFTLTFKVEIVDQRKKEKTVYFSVTFSLVNYIIFTHAFTCSLMIMNFLFNIREKLFYILTGFGKEILRHLFIIMQN